jgi:hypothetical protein
LFGNRIVKQSALTDIIKKHDKNLENISFNPSVSACSKLIGEAHSAKKATTVLFLVVTPPKLGSSYGHCLLAIHRSGDLRYIDPLQRPLAWNCLSNFACKLQKRFGLSGEPPRCFGTQNRGLLCFSSCLKFAADLLDGKSLDKFKWTSNSDLGIYSRGYKYKNK